MGNWLTQAKAKSLNLPDTPESINASEIQGCGTGPELEREPADVVGRAPPVLGHM